MAVYGKGCLLPAEIPHPCDNHNLPLIVFNDVGGETHQCHNFMMGVFILLDHICLNCGKVHCSLVHKLERGVPRGDRILAYGSGESGIVINCCHLPLSGQIKTMQWFFSLFWLHFRLFLTG